VFIINSLFIAQATPDIKDIGRYISGNPPSADAVPLALNQLWDIAMQGNLYRLTSSIGLLIAVLAVGFWCVKFYQALEEGGLKPAVNEMIFPIILIIFLSNGGRGLSEATSSVRDIMNNVNQSVNKVIDSEVSLETAIKVLGDTSLTRAAIDFTYAICNANLDEEKFDTCMSEAIKVGNAVVARRTSSWPTGGGTKMRDALKKWQKSLEDLTKNRATTPQAAQKDLSLSIGSAGFKKDGSLNATAQELERIALSFRGSFLYIVETMMLITGLVGPIFLGLSLFPVGTKPLIAWGTSFLSLGFCKICFSLISGLSAVAMVFAGPDNVDMLVASLTLGVLAPVLAFSIASGSGIQALSTVSYSTQGFGMSSGITPYTPQVLNNQPDPSKPTTTPAKSDGAAR
jgi:hypothetical protein